MQIPDLESDDPIEDKAGLFDADLRNDIIHGINVHTQLSETDITERLRQQRNETITKAAGIAAILLILTGTIFAYRAYLNSITFLHPGDITFAQGKRYTFAVSQSGTFLLDAFLIVNPPQTQGEHTLYRIEQIAPDANDTFYWSIRDDGFYQFLNPQDTHPQFYVPLPLRPGMTWKAKTYPSNSNSTNKQPVDATFTAGEEVTLELPIGTTTAIQITATSKEDDDPITLWISKQAPITKLNVDTDDPTFIAELKNIDTINNQ